MARVYGRPWQKGQSGNPHGRPLGASTAHAKMWFERLRIAAHRKAKVGPDGKPVLVKYKEGKTVDLLSGVAADKVMGVGVRRQHVGGRAHGQPSRRQGA